MDPFIVFFAFFALGLIVAMRRLARARAAPANEPVAAEVIVVEHHEHRHVTVLDAEEPARGSLP